MIRAVFFYKSQAGCWARFSVPQNQLYTHAGMASKIKANRMSRA